MKEIHEYPLNPENIDKISIEVADFLEQLQTESKDKIRIRLSIEEILLQWLEVLGENVDCSLSYGRSIGRTIITISAKGEEFNPFDDTKEIEFTGGKGLLDSLGLFPSFNYVNGVNEISIFPKKRELSPIIKMFMAIAIAVAASLPLNQLSATSKADLSKLVITPIFQTMINMITCAAIPLIFLSISWSILNIGTLTELGKIGKVIVKRFIGFAFIYGFVASLLIFPFSDLTIHQANGGNAAFAKLLKMILDIVPGNLVEPFTSGNALQVIFIAACFGVFLLMIGKKAGIISRLVENLYDLFRVIMTTINKLLPFFIGISTFNFMISGELSQLNNLYKIVLFVIIGCVLISLMAIIYISLRLHISLKLLLKKFLPCLIIEFTTASSAAAYATNLETCEQKLGIDRQIVNFALPLGQVIYMPGCIVMMLAIGYGFASIYNVPISLPWLLIAAVTSTMLSIAAPPIPGGALTCFSVMIHQLGIPSTAIALAMALDVIFEMFATFSNLTCLKCELILVARKLGRLNIHKLKSE